MDKPDIVIEDHRLDLEMAVGRDDDEEGLRRRHHPADGVDRKLLDDAVDRRGQPLQICLLLRLDDFLGETGGLCLGLGQLVVARPAPFGLGLRQRLDNRRYRRLGLVMLALLDPELLLLLDQLLKRLQIGQARSDLLVEQRLPNVDLLLQQRDQSFAFGDHRHARRALGFALRLLLVERRELGAILRHLSVRNWRWVVTSAGSAPAGGRKSWSGSSFSLNAARNRATSSSAATRSPFSRPRSAALIVGSSSMSRSPAFTG